MEVLLVGLGGTFGACARYAVGQLLRGHSFPWATLAVNVLGSFVLGIVLFAGLTRPVGLLIGVGFCGAFTTFSSFSYQTVELWEGDHPGLAAANAVGNLIASLSAFAIAWLIVG